MQKFVTLVLSCSLIALSAQATPTRVIIMTDSHGLGPFGAQLDRNLLNLDVTEVVTAAVGGGSPHWFDMGAKGRCSYFHTAKKGEPLPPRKCREMKTPLARELVQTPDEQLNQMTLIELGGNLIRDDRSRKWKVRTVTDLVSLVLERQNHCLWLGPTDSRYFTQAELQENFEMLQEGIEKANALFPDMKPCRLIDSRPLAPYPATGGDGIHFSFPAGKPIAHAWANTVTLTVKEMLGLGKPCPDDTVRVQGYCIDRYEAPNIKGAQPFAAKGANEGAAWCALRGKRLCTEKEWVTACSSGSQKAYPYGHNYKKGKCVDDKIWRVPNWALIQKVNTPEGQAHIKHLYQADPSGKRTECKTDEGVFDMPGNVSEWVTLAFPTSSGNTEGMMGCYWSGCYNMMIPHGIKPGCYRTRNAAHPGNANLFRTYEAGFRCCQDASL